MITVFLCPRDRQGLPARIAALAERSGRTPEVVLLVGADAGRCLRGWDKSFGIRTFTERRDVKAHLQSLSDRGSIDLVVADWPEALSWPEIAELGPRLILENWNGSAEPEGARRKQRRARRRLQDLARSVLFSGFWPSIRSPEERVALAPIVTRVEPWSAAMWTSTRSDAWFHELIRGPFVIIRCPSVDGRRVEDAVAEALQNSDSGTSILWVRDGIDRSIVHADRFVSCGAIPELYLALEKARGALIEPFPFLAFAAATRGTPIVVCPYAGSVDSERDADFVAQRFGARRGNVTESMGLWLRRLMAGVLEAPNPPVVDVALEAQERSIGQAVEWLDQPSS